MAIQRIYQHNESNCQLLVETGFLKWTYKLFIDDKAVETRSGFHGLDDRIMVTVSSSQFGKQEHYYLVVGRDSIFLSDTTAYWHPTKEWT